MSSFKTVNLRELTSMGMDEDNAIEELIYKIVGPPMRVHREIGYALREKTYERALVVEFEHLGVSHNQQNQYPIIYRSVKVDEYIPDLEVEKDNYLRYENY